jgi:trk system potassium uptake protein TrkA
MRIGLIGSTALAVSTARRLLKRGHEVVIVEARKERIDQLADDLDCGFLHGDGTRPSIQRELGPENTDVLYCLTDNDQDNILAALVGRSLGFERVVPKILEPDYEPICTELGLTDTIVPDETIARHLADNLEGKNIMELSSLLRGDVRFFPVAIGDDGPGAVQDLELPKKTRAICIYRGDDFLLPDDETRLRDGDQVLLITSSEQLPRLKERWGSGEETRQGTDANVSENVQG